MGGSVDAFTEHWQLSQSTIWRQYMSAPIQFVRLRAEAVVPRLAKDGDVGYDLVCLDGGRIEPHTYASFGTGIAMALPSGLWVMIVGRSSTWRQRKLWASQAVIDSGYTGELLAGVFNPNDHYVIVEPGARLKQLVIMPALTPPWVEVTKLPETERGTTGFGSTGS